LIEDKGNLPPFSFLSEGARHTVSKEKARLNKKAAELLANALKEPGLARKAGNWPN